MYQGASDDFLGARADMPFPSEQDGIDFEAEFGVIVDYVPMGTPASLALPHIKLLTLLNDASLRLLAARELKTGFGFLQSKPATSFAPVVLQKCLKSSMAPGSVASTCIVAPGGRALSALRAFKTGSGHFMPLVSTMTGEVMATTRRLAQNPIFGWSSANWTSGLKSSAMV